MLAETVFVVYVTVLLYMLVEIALAVYVTILLCMLAETATDAPLYLSEIILIIFVTIKHIQTILKQ